MLDGFLNSIFFTILRIKAVDPSENLDYSGLFSKEKKRQKFNVRTPNLFDIVLRGKSYRGHYETINHYDEAVRYCIKGGEYEVTDSTIMDSLFNSRQKAEYQKKMAEGLLKPKDVFKELESAPTQKQVKKAIESYNLSKDVRELKDTDALSEVPKSNFTIDDFDLPPKLKDWVYTPFDQKVALVLVGHSNTGKSALIKTVADLLKLPMLTVNERNALKHLSRDHKIIFLDD